MATISLNKTKIYKKEATGKYWRNVECAPQTVELKTWSTNHPYFILSGVVVNSHDKNEIGKKMEIHNQSYSFWLNDLINEGVYSLNK